MDWRPILGVFPPHTQRSSVPGIHSGPDKPDPDKGLYEDEGMNE